RDHAERSRAADATDGQDRALWMIAADAEINDDLVTDGVSTPGVMVLPSHFNAPEGRMAEDYFGLLQLDPAAQSCESDDCGSGADGCERDWDDGASATLSPFVCGLIRRKCACDILAGKEAGTVPLGWLRWAEGVLESKTDWRRVLASEIRRG